jgi:hypothetical protein
MKNVRDEVWNYVFADAHNIVYKDTCSNTTITTYVRNNTWNNVGDNIKHNLKTPSKTQLNNAYIVLESL